MKIDLFKKQAQALPTLSITINISLLTVLIAISSCSTPPGKAIQKRWKTVGVVGNERKQKEYQHLFERQSVELEFLPNSVFRGYRNGRQLGTGTYTMAPDNKSVLIANNGMNFTLNIISLEKDKLIAQSITSVSKEDTLIYSPQ